MLKEIFEALKPLFEAEGARAIWTKSGKFAVAISNDSVKGVVSVRLSEDRVVFQVAFEARDEKGLPLLFCFDELPYAKEAYAYLLMRNAFDDRALWMMDYIRNTIHMGYVVPVDKILPSVGDDAKSAVKSIVQSVDVAQNALGYAQTGAFPSDQIALLRRMYQGTYTL